LGHCEVLYVLFFLIFYSLFGPCPARPFIFSYLLLFIWHLPCPARPFIFPYLLLFIWPLPFPHGPAPCPALQDRRTDGPCPAPCPALPCLAARFSESRDPFSESRFPNPTVRAESGFPNPTVRAGSTTSIKTRNRRRTDRRTDTILALIYKMVGLVLPDNELKRIHKSYDLARLSLLRVDREGIEIGGSILQPKLKTSRVVLDHQLSS
jgi:hypothetical protein